MNNLNKQSGFTLVEIAIVLVIIGLLLGGVLKGQEMIKNAEIRSVITDVQGLTTAMYAYRDRYNAIPGDDALGVTHTSLTKSDGDGDGVIEASAAAGTDENEDVNFFAHLRAVNLLTGSGVTLPSHSLGGSLSVSNGTNGLSGNVVCASAVDEADALIIDTKEDDGVYNTGAIRGASVYTGTTGGIALCFEL
ncbi:hypothetical protein A9Q82_00165 [Cycloclasticus sp. 46_120_T64]|nr:hypothetical protein A9Q82_00165 [Cycloclasticus sp. 46_120_T64]